jgi:hypothetical protein
VGLVEDLLNNPVLGMWDHVLIMFAEPPGKGKIGYVSKAICEFDYSSLAIVPRPDHESFDSLELNCTEEENDITLKTIRTLAWATLLNDHGIPG